MTARIKSGLNIDPANQEHGKPSPKDLQDLGASWVRFVFKVRKGSPEALKAAFNAYDGYISALKDEGIEILLILNNESVPNWPVDRPNADDAAWQAYRPRFAESCEKIARHYQGKVNAYQIWNEPDFHAPRPDYNPTLSPAVFGQMLKLSHAAIKGVNPEIGVVIGGLASGQPHWLDWVKAASDNKLYADAVGVHPYGRRPTPDWPTPDWGGLGPMKDLLQAYADRARPLPLWISEMGTEDGHYQGEFPEKAYDALNRTLAGDAPLAFWFCWSDGMVNGFGLRDKSGKKKKAYDSYQRFARQATREAAAKSTVEAQPRLRTALLKEAARRHLLTLDTNTALAGRIIADGFMPNSAEFGLEIAGVHYRAQRADDPATGKTRIYYARGPRWQPVGFVERP